MQVKLGEPFTLIFKKAETVERGSGQDYQTISRGQNYWTNKEVGNIRQFFFNSFDSE